MAEYDHMAELGLVEDKQLICSDVGFITRNDPLRGLCEEYIRNGGRLYDLLSRYDLVISYALSRADGNCGNVCKRMVPILMANGITDSGAYATCKKNLEYMPGAKQVFTYLSKQLPTFICTETYGHQMMLLSEEMDIPMDHISCNTFMFEDMELHKPEARKLREIIPQFANMRLSDEKYTISESRFLTYDDNELIDIVDKELIKPMDKMDIMEAARNALKVSGNEKAYAVLELCRKNEIHMSDTAFIGTRDSDFAAMDIVRDSAGLALSFCGSEYAVRGCNVAVLSDRPIVAAVLVNEFYNGGIQSVMEMIDHWTPDGLREWPCADRHLMNEMLAEFPNGLPEVYKVDVSNRREIAKKSIEFAKSVRRI